MTRHCSCNDVLAAAMARHCSSVRPSKSREEGRMEEIRDFRETQGTKDDFGHKNILRPGRKPSGHGRIFEGNSGH
jgi:hypothetical protein